MLALLLGCGLRRSELVTLKSDQIQRREDHWVIVDLVGKGRHIRTVPIPWWVKADLDTWISAAGIREGKLFRSIRKDGAVWGLGVTQNVVWYVVKKCAERAGIDRLAPHDLRRSCARLCHRSRNWRAGADSVSTRAYHGADHGTLRRVQATAE